MVVNHDSWWLNEAPLMKQTTKKQRWSSTAEKALLIMNHCDDFLEAFRNFEVQFAFWDHICTSEPRCGSTRSSACKSHCHLLGSLVSALLIAMAMVREKPFKLLIGQVTYSKWLLTHKFWLKTLQTFFGVKTFDHVDPLRLMPLGPSISKSQLRSHNM